MSPFVSQRYHQIALTREKRLASGRPSGPSPAATTKGPNAVVRSGAGTAFRKSILTSCPLRVLTGGPDDVGTDREVFDLINMDRACDRSQVLTVPFFRDPSFHPVHRTA